MQNKNTLLDDRLSDDKTRTVGDGAGLPLYERPHIISYSAEDIMDQLGPAQASTSTPAPL